jgi:hypothetical protein
LIDIGADALKGMATNLPVLRGLGKLGAVEPVVEVGDPQLFPSADAFPSYTGTSLIPASSAEVKEARRTIG